MNYLTPAEILYIHDRLSKEINGSGQIADIKILKKAVKFIHDNEMFPDLFSKAGALFFAIARKRPFIEQNLPTALYALGVFMGINHHQIDISDSEVHAFIQKDLSSASLQEITGWIKSVSYKMQIPA